MAGEVNVNEKEVHVNILNEIKKLGDSVTASKTNYEEMRKTHKKLEEVVNSGEEGRKGQIEKLKEEIVTRQEENEKNNKEMQGKMDALELAMKRPSNKLIEPGSNEYKEAQEFLISSLAVRRERASYDTVKSMKVDVDAYKAYCETFETFLRKDRELLTPEQVKALSVGVDPDGGITVTPSMSSKITAKLYESDPIRQLSRVENISTDAFEEMVDWSEASSGWETETQHGDETDTPKFKKKRIPVHIMYAAPRVTQQLLEDSGINIEAWLAGKVAEKFNRVEAASFVTGNGVGKPVGFLTYDNGTTYGTIQQINMGVADKITADGYIDIKYSLQEYYVNRGTWLMNRQTVRDTMTLKDGIGNYLWKPAFAVDAPSTILSLPVRMSTTMPVVAANSLSVVLADWKEAYCIVDRLGITIQRDPYTVKPFIEYYTRRRVGADVTNWDAIKIGKIAV